MYSEPSVRAPSREHLAKIADKIGFKSDQDDLEVYHKVIKESCDAINELDNLPEPSIPTKYPRLPGYRPAPDENKLNAWYWKTNIVGSQYGKLAGKTVAVKDNIAVAGVPMMVGCSALDGYVPEFDATVVTRVLDAGGCIRGKSVCESLCASGDSFTGNKGPVRNHHNPWHSAGGSSSGSATLVAAAEVDLALGSDQGGSVRLPACWCGVVGLKPTHGLIPYTGAMAFEPSVDHLGPIARNVYDCALFLEVLAGYDDGMDPRQKHDINIPTYTQEMKSESLEGMRIGLVKEGFGWEGADSQVEDIVKRNVLALKEKGAIVEEVSVPLHKQSNAIWRLVYIDGFTDTTFKTGGTGRGAAGFYPTSLSSFVCKSLRTRPNDIPHSAKILYLLSEYLSECYPGVIYSKGQNLRRLLIKDYDKALEKYDILAMPTIPFTATPLPVKDINTEEYLRRLSVIPVNTRCFNMTGHPAISINAGFHDNGLPVGAMFIAKHFDEVTIFKVANHFEKLITERSTSSSD